MEAGVFSSDEVAVLMPSSFACFCASFFTAAFSAGVAMGIVLDGGEQTEIRPAARWQRTALTQHGAHQSRLPMELVRGRADDLAAYNGSSRLAEQTGVHLLAKVLDPIPFHDDIDGDGRAAKLGPRRSARVGMGEPLRPRDGGRDFEQL